MGLKRITTITLDLSRWMKYGMKSIDSNESVRSINDHPAFGIGSNQKDAEDLHDDIQRSRRMRVNVI